MKLRNAELSDSQMLFKWVNERQVREMAFSQRTISWETHYAWFKNKIENSKSRIYIAIEDNGRPFGQIRFDILSSSKAEVDIHIETKKRGSGAGSNIIKLGTERLFKETKIESIQATVKQKNIGSMKAFIKAGYTEKRKRVIESIDCIEMIIERQ